MIKGQLGSAEEQEQSHLQTTQNHGAEMMGGGETHSSVP